MGDERILPRTDGGLERRGLLKCMVWAGTGVLWTMSGGVPRSTLLASAAASEMTEAPAGAGFSFMQISDSHIGFANAPNTDTPGTLREAIGLVRQQKGDAALMIHTGDVSQLSKPAQFDTADQIIREAGLETHFVPGEHDVLVDDGQPFFERFTKGGERGWYSFDQEGVHFVGLNNVQDLKAGGLGNLGRDQLTWLERDLAGRASSQPIVVFAHVPLWTVSQEWGWGTDDGAQALALLRRFGSVTVLNGHIHQIMQKVEGTVAFHTACSTAFPQPAPGTAASPGPIKDLPAGRLRSTLGVTRIARVAGKPGLAIIDTPLGA
ncbi:MAG: metallophosphoesterase [Acetobacteraceae bacterium]|nr:metallophosphoesterase [Acetobacteraceae bacterium]